ncbi:unnamed protein product, partial [Candidula unifasciata]
KGYSRVIVASSHHQSLFNVDDLKAMCHLESTYFRASSVYQDLCISNEASGDCCQAWSIGNYVAVLSDKTSCLDITGEDVSSIYQLLSVCAPFFHNLSLGPNCAGGAYEWYYSHSHPASQCPGVPESCKKYNAVYYILHFLADSEFMHPRVSTHASTSEESASSGTPSSMLKFSSIFLPLVARSQAIHVFKHLESMPREFNSITIVGAHFGVKFALFEEYLLSDSVWLGLVCVVIFLSLWLYTTSFFVTVMTFLSMFWAVEVAYFLYTFVFKIKFFPYMNMVTLIVMLGIGADDLFIYCRVWNLAKSEKNNGIIEKIISDTLHHTVLSMLVTSLTTAAAFYANYISDITAVRCFSVFAGTTVMINFVLTVTWLPASIMLHEKWLRCCVRLNDRNLSCCYSVCTVPYKIYYFLCDWSRIFFEKLLPCLVIKFRYIWIILFGGLWICSIIVIFFYPRFKLPSSHKFQVFASDHLLERYDFELSDLFDFERAEESEELPMFPITIVWGVLPTDNGDPLDPYNKGSLTYDPSFDLTSPNAQQWILDFCSRLRRSDFYQHYPGIQLTDCFLENFVHRWMKQPCHKENLECCNQTKFPFTKSKMITCLSSYIPLLTSTPGIHYNSRSPGPRFNNGKITAFFVQFLSNHSFSHSYEDVQSFYLKVDNWVREELLQAPVEMKRGWFVSSLDFYDLQSSLAMGTPLALGVSLSVVAVVSFFTTLNVLISLYALLSVAATICVTLASLVFMQWELGVLESVVITIAIGLAVDLTLHYGVAFRLSPDLGREMRVINSLGRMGSPVAMAAFTTMMAGAFMMFSTVLVYKKFGTFLLLLVSLAWVYATFFFLALLRTIGPHESFGQFHWPVFDCCSPSSREHIDKTIYALSESTLSSSSTSTREHSSVHYSHNQELAPLTDSDNHSQKTCHHQHSAPCNCDRQQHRHHSRQHSHHHHHHHRSRRRSDYSSVRTAVSSTETSPLRNQDNNLLTVTRTSSRNSTSSPSPENTLAVPLDPHVSGHSRGDSTTQDSEGSTSDTSNTSPGIGQHMITQAQIEISTFSQPLQVA